MFEREYNLSHMLSDEVKKRQSRRRWIFMCSISILVLLLAYITLPYIAESWTRDWLARQGIYNLNIESTDFNLFSGEVIYRNISIEEEQTHQLRIAYLSLDFDWIPLFMQKGMVRELKIQNADISIEKGHQSQVTIGGFQLDLNDSKLRLVNSNNATSSKSWSVGVERTQILNTRVHLKLKDRSDIVEIRQLQIQDLYSWPESINTAFKGRLAILDSEISFNGSAPLHSERIEVKGSVVATNLPLRKLPQLSAINERLSVDANVDIDTEISITEDENKAYSATLSGSAALNNLTAGYNESSFLQNKGDWNGKVNLSLNSDLNLTSIYLSGTMNGEDVELTNADNDVITHSDRYKWQGNLEYKINAKHTQSLHNTATIDVNELSIVDQRKNRMLVKLGRVYLVNAQYDNEKLFDLPSVEFEQLSLFNKNQGANEAKTTDNAGKNPFLKASTFIESGKIEEIRYDSDNDISISSVQINNLSGKIERKRNTQWKVFDNILTSLNTHYSDLIARFNIAGSDRTRLQSSYKIGKILVSGIGNLVIIDHSTKPASSFKLSPYNFELTAIDSFNTNKTSTFKLQATVDNVANINMSGKLKPFQSPLSFNANAKIQNLPVTLINSYAKLKLGIGLKQGQLSTVSSLDFKDGTITLANKFELSDLKLAITNEKRAKHFTKQLNFPADKAVALLSDKNGTLKLKVSTIASLKKNDMHIKLNKALGRALQSAVAKDVRATLAPWNSLKPFITPSGRKTAAMKFKPVVFTAGTSKLEKSSTRYLDRLADLMRKRPQLRITICGVASSQDKKIITKSNKSKKLSKKSLKKSLLSIAEERGKTVKEYMVSKQSIESKKLYMCNPLVSYHKNSQPVVEILI